MSFKACDVLTQLAYLSHIIHMSSQYLMFTFLLVYINKSFYLCAKFCHLCADVIYLL